MTAIRDLIVAINRLAAAIEVTRTPVTVTLPGRAPQRHPAQDMPAPRGYMCAAQCGHGIAVHRQHGCDVNGCDCPAPFGRLMQADVPDDASGLTGDVTS